MRLPHPLPEEKTILIVRRHGMVFLVNIFYNFLLLLVPLPVLWFALKNFPSLFNGTISWPIIVILLSIYYLISWLFFFVHFIDLYLDVWIITNKRLINIEQKGLFSRTEAEHQLYVIQDVTTKVAGIMPTVFNYGDLEIQNAGESQRITFRQVGDPYAIKKIIADLVDKTKSLEKNNNQITRP